MAELWLSRRRRHATATSATATSRQHAAPAAAPAISGMSGVESGAADAGASVDRLSVLVAVAKLCVVEIVAVVVTVASAAVVAAGVEIGAVAAGVGLCVGAGVSATVKATAGVEIGAVAAGVGLCVGVGVGATVGATAGVEIGAVAAGVGLCVGAGVGATVKATAVGAGVHTRVVVQLQNTGQLTMHVSIKRHFLSVSCAVDETGGNGPLKKVRPPSRYDSCDKEIRLGNVPETEFRTTLKCVSEAGSGGMVPVSWQNETSKNASELKSRSSGMVPTTLFDQRLSIVSLVRRVSADDNEPAKLCSSIMIVVTSPSLHVNEGHGSCGPKRGHTAALHSAGRTVS